MTENRSLSSQDMLAMLMELDAHETAMLDVDPGGRFGTFQEAGFFFKAGSQQRGRIWLPSAERWEERAAEVHAMQVPVQVPGHEAVESGDGAGVVTLKRG